ncbi:MAG: aspartate carbamoyltransferase catalytic subunit [Terriglobales bacterium]|jgi:aspartate carbamoyltransferase catalytic subunit
MAKRRSLLDLEHLSTDDMTGLLRLARRMQRGGPRPLLRRNRIALLFYESSTRTRVSFEFAAKALGATTSVITATASSIEKGESLLDTGYTLRALGTDLIVMRHPSSGAPHVLARNLDIPVVNAGDGLHEHPSQGLLDAYTILRHKKNLKGLRVAIVGDIFHSRVARSATQLLTRFGAHVTLCGPPELCPEIASTLAKNSSVVRHLDPAIRGVDVVMMLRIQKERLAGMNLDIPAYVAAYQLTADKLRIAKKDAIVMHPGPMLRGLEIAGEVADSSQSVIREQVENGVAVRMAILAWCLGAAK